MGGPARKQQQVIAHQPEELFRTLSPENVNGDHVAGEGHLHIYANGQKLGRLYGTATHIAALPDGDVEISVVAYTNDHMPYELDGQPISDAVTVTVPA